MDFFRNKIIIPIDESYHSIDTNHVHGCKIERGCRLTFRRSESCVVVVKTFEQGVTECRDEQEQSRIEKQPT